MKKVLLQIISSKLFPSSPSFEETYHRIKNHGITNKHDIKNLKSLRNSSEEDLLSYAVRIADHDMVSKLLKYGADPKVVSINGSTLLHINMQALVEASNIDSIDIHQCIELSERGIRGACEVIIHKIRPGLSNLEQLAGKLYLVGKDFTAIIAINKMLIEAGLDVNQKDKNGETVAHYLAKSGLGALLPDIFQGVYIDYSITNSSLKTPLSLTLAYLDPLSFFKLLGKDTNCALSKEDALNLNYLFNVLSLGASKQKAVIYDILYQIVQYLDSHLIDNINNVAYINRQLSIYEEHFYPFLEVILKEIEQSKLSANLNYAEKLAKLHDSIVSLIKKIDFISETYYEYNFCDEAQNMDFGDDSFELMEYSGEDQLD
jgi:hypothetical protein